MIKFRPLFIVASLLSIWSIHQSFVQAECQSLLTGNVSSVNQKASLSEQERWICLQIHLKCELERAKKIHHKLGTFLRNHALLITALSGFLLSFPIAKRGSKFDGGQFINAISEDLCGDSYAQFNRRPLLQLLCVNCSNVFHMISKSMGS